MFGTSIVMDKSQLPSRTLKNKSYRQLGDIYLNIHCGIDRFKEKIENYANTLKVKVEF